jgi:hypothetical protein
MFHIIQRNQNHNGNGVDGNGSAGNGSAANGGSVKQAGKRVRRVKPHVKNGYNQAACRAYGAVYLVQKCGFSIEAAIACTGSNTNYVIAMKWVVASGDETLLDHVLRNQRDIFWAAEQVRPMVEIKAAYKKLTSEQRIAWAMEENPNRLFDETIIPALSMQKTVMAEPAITDVA